MTTPNLPELPEPTYLVAEEALRKGMHPCYTNEQTLKQHGKEGLYCNAYTTEQMLAFHEAGRQALAELGRVALRLAKDGNYRHRAAEEILRLMEPLGAAISSNRRTSGGLTECDMHDDESY